MAELHDLPNDVGLLPGPSKPLSICIFRESHNLTFAGTFIMPGRRNRPSLVNAPRERLTLEWTRMKRMFLDLGSLLIYKSFTKPWLKLRRRQVAPTAVALHQQMYTAFADADVETLRKICGDGLLSKFRSGIHSRGRETLEWVLHKYTKASRIVSHRAARLPVEGTAVQQAVVRIQSRQSLTRYGPDRKVVAGTGQEREIREYVVLQKRLLQGKEGPWIVWGTTGETSFDDLMEEEARMRGGP
ncbi:MAG: hypothetical protein M1833_007012 [Piccolia ochrophora]|nr:MAG: hypothetical protein M1833_007012 [Piccolia ochrophora]